MNRLSLLVESQSESTSWQVLDKIVYHCMASCSDEVSSFTFTLTPFYKGTLSLIVNQATRRKFRYPDVTDELLRYQYFTRGEKKKIFHCWKRRVMRQSPQTDLSLCSFYSHGKVKPEMLTIFILYSVIPLERSREIFIRHLKASYCIREMGNENWVKVTILGQGQIKIVQSNIQSLIMMACDMLW